MTIVLLIACGISAGISVLLYYNIAYMEWCYWGSIVVFVIACIFALGVVVSIILGIIERRRRKAQLAHKRYLDMVTASNTRKIILEFPPKSPQNQVYTALPSYPIAKARKNKSKRK